MSGRGHGQGSLVQFMRQWVGGIRSVGHLAPRLSPVVRLERTFSSFMPLRRAPRRPNPASLVVVRPRRSSARRNPALAHVRACCAGLQFADSPVSNAPADVVFSAKSTCWFFWNCHDLRMPAKIHRKPYSMRAFGHSSLPFSGHKRDVAETPTGLCILS